MTDLAPLYSLEAERSVLGGLLFRPALIGTLPIQTEDFFSPKHQVIWQAMVNLDESASPVDATTVIGEVRRMGRLGGFTDEAGAAAYVADLMGYCPSAENVAHYVKSELHRYARKRQMVTLYAETLHKLKTSDIADFEDLRTEAIIRLQKLDDTLEDPSRPLADLMREEVLAIQHDIDNPRGEWVAAMPTGIRALDQNIGGLPLGSITVVLGDTGHGKTSLAMQFLRAAVRIANDRPVLFSYEDSLRSYARRGLAQESGVSTQRIGARRFGEGDAQKVIVDGIRNLGHRRERIVRFRGQTMSDVCQAIRRIRVKGPEHGASSVGRLCVIDYWQAIKAPPGRREMSPVEAFAENARMLEDLADEQDIAVVVMSQVNDETEKRKGVPALRDVAGGRDLVKGAKMVLGIYRPSMFEEKADPSIGKLIILKNNAGETHAPTGERRAVDVKLNLAIHQIGDVDP